MNNPFRTLTLIAVLTGACMSMGPALRAAENGGKGDKKPGDFSKYDRNHNGKLDPDEAAAMKAEKLKTEKKPTGTKK